MKSAWLAQFKKLLLIVMVAPLITCGNKKSRSDASSEFRAVPDEPIVIIGDTKDDVLRSIPGPWFFFMLKIKNTDATDSITIIALEVTISGTDADGMPFSVVKTFSASDFNHSVAQSGGTELQCTYTNFGTFAPGTGEQDVGVGGTGACEMPVTRFFIGGMPTKPQGAVYRFNVSVRPLGWFGTFDNPTDRFDTTIRFQTR